MDGVWREYGAPDEVHGGGKKFEKFRKEALLHGMTLVESPVRHMGTERSYDILTRMRAELETKVEVLTRSRVERILAEKPAGESELRATGVVLEDGTRLTSDAVIAAPGRDGAAWLMEECKRLHIAMRTNPVDIGVRVEVSAAVMEPLTTALYESKLIYYTPRFDDPVRTFCMNPYGAVSLENYGDVVTVNGHSYADFKTDRTNFALLVSTDFTEPFDDPIAYGKSIARLANVLGEDIIVQRLGDLHQGHRSTMDRIRRGTVQPTLQGATAGDLAFVLPYRHLTDILEMLAAMDKIAPGVNGRDTLLYGVEVKFYSARPELDDGLQTPVKNLYAVGAPDEVHGGGKKFEKFRKEALLHGMTLVESPVRHMGTERSYDILTRMRAELETKVEVLTRSRVERILAEKPAGESDLRATGVVLEDGTRLTSDAVIAAPGRDGAAWLMEECKRLRIAMRTNPVDIGVRVEVSAAVLEPLTTALYESKLIYYTPRFDDPVRTFCMNPYGAVSLENYGDVVTVNGHSYADFKTDRTNFALLVTTDFTEPFGEPIAYGKCIARLANVLGEDIIVQRLGDLEQGHRSTSDRIRRSTVQPTLEDATAGDLSFVLPYRHLTDILEMLAAMDNIAPGVY